MKAKKCLLIAVMIFIILFIPGGTLLAFATKQIIYQDGLYWRIKRAPAVVTAYCQCRICCGDDARGITATGKKATICDGCAVDHKLIPYGSLLYVPGAGYKVADDTGGAMRQDAKKGIYHIDVRFADHQEARRWGKKKLTIAVYKKITSINKSKPESPVTYTVKAGDSLSEIARRRNTTVPALMQLNNIKDPNKIWPNQIIKLK